MSESEPTPKPRITLQAAANFVNQRHVSLWLYATIAYLTAWGEVLEGDAVKQLIPPSWLFLADSFCYTTGAALLAVKMVMSTSWADPTKDTNAPDR